MAANTNTAKKKSTRPTRKGVKRYELVTFTLDGFEGEFTVPRFGQIPKTVLRAVETGGDELIEEFLIEHSKDAGEVFRDELDLDESKAFIRSWVEASGVDLPKSV